MMRRDVLRGALAAAAWSLTARGTAAESGIVPLEKSKAQWRKILPEARYRILFEEATERAFTSPLNDEKRRGTYICAACFLPLFDSSAKFDSGTGWPSFTQPIAGHVATKRDFKLVFVFQAKWTDA